MTDSTTDHQALGCSQQTAAIDPKTWATLQARAALVEVSLVRSTDDRDRPIFIASKWALTTRLDSVEAVETFLRRIGGPAA